MEVSHWPAELAFASHAELGEGPHWDHATGTLLWVDVRGEKVHVFDPGSGSDRSFAPGQAVGAAVPRRGAGFALALRDGFATVDNEGGDLTWVAQLEADNPGTRMNDGACDSAGRFWAGTMDIAEKQPLGSLYRLDPGGEVETMLGGITISNGIGWSPDETVMYYVDTATLTVEAFAFNVREGTISERRELIAIEPGAGSPDGLTVDADGSIWLALWGGWAVRKYTPAGELAGIVDVPAACPTSCAFGGDELDTLYITSAAPDSPDRRQPHAGGVFRASTGSRGLPAHAFAG